MTQPVKTFSIGFEDETENELPYARQVAQHFGTDHHEFIVRPELISVLPQLVWAFDEPFADSSMLPTYYVSKLAREFVTVALTGDGGDEIFGGYMSYQRELAIDRLPAGVRFLSRHLGKHVADLMPEGMRGKRRLTALGSDLGTRTANVNAVFSFASRPCLYDPDFYAQVQDHDPRERKLSLFRPTEHLDTAARMQYADTHLYLPDDILVKVDKASMLNSLETRTPMLDQHLVAYVASLPSAIRTRDDTLKYLLKRVADGMLPEGLLTRRKHGFDPPMQRWLRTDLAEYARELLDAPRAHGRGIFRPEYVRHLLQTHTQARVKGSGREIWALLCLELWFQVYLDPAPLSLQQTRRVELEATHASGLGSAGRLADRA
jgi:asparagine synthase (glutamine-hydrolysing)